MATHPPTPWTRVHTDICFRLLLGPSHNHVKADLTAAVYPSWGPPTPPPLLLLAGNILERQAAPPPCLHHPTCHSRARCIALEPQEPSVAPYHPKDQAMLLSPASKPSNPPPPMLPNQAPTDSSPPRNLHFSSDLPSSHHCSGLPLSPRPLSPAAAPFQTSSTSCFLCSYLSLTTPCCLTNSCEKQRSEKQRRKG